MIICSIIVIPFTLRKKIQAFKVLNFLGLINKFGIFFMLIVVLATGAGSKKPNVKLFPHPDSQSTFGLSDFLSYTAAMILPFTFQPIFLELFQEKGYGKNQRLEKVLLISQLAIFFCYYIFGLFGYWAFGEAVSHDILVDFRRENMGAALYIITYVFAILGLLFTYPVWFFPLKKQLFYLLLSVDFFFRWKLSSPELKDYIKNNYRSMKLRFTNDKLKSTYFQIFTLVLDFLVALIALTSTNSFLYVFDLVCMIIFPFINYGLPALLFLKLKWTRKDRYFYLALIYMLTVAVFSGLAFGAVLYEFIVWY